MKREAIFSKDRKYRYSIERVWDSTRKSVVFICLNPSTADEYEEDQTLTRCINFSRDWGYGSVEVVNLFAFKATDPTDLKSSLHPVGTENDRYIEEAVEGADLVVAAWGEHGKYRRRNREVLYLIRKLDKEIYCLEVLKCKEPKHPSRARADLKPIPYKL